MSGCPFHAPALPCREITLHGYLLKGGKWSLSHGKALSLIFRDLSPLLEEEGVGGEVQAKRTKREYGLVWYNTPLR